MKIRYFAETDTLYIEFRDAPVRETCELDDNTLLDSPEGCPCVHPSLDSGEGDSKSFRLPPPD